MKQLATWIQNTRRLLGSAERNGRFSPSLLAGDLVFTAWLALAQRVFLNLPQASWVHVALPALMMALLTWAWRWHDFRGTSFLRLLFKGVAIALTASVGLALLHHAGIVTLSMRACLWLAAGATVLLLVMRVAHLATRAAWPDQPLEIFRWIGVISVTFALMWPFVTADSIGAGDAYWYTIMLADFTTQWRAGVFPVWIGQSEYAFNGAISPLRFAPWFQHWGGMLDLVSFHSLRYTALKNATLVTSALVGGLTAYTCLRAILSRRPWLAVMLAVLWMASPGVLAPLMAGDQYMTFMTLPFVAIVLYGTWRTWAHDDRGARWALAAGLAGLWLSHTPIALWMCLFAGGNYAAKIMIRRTWRLEPSRLAGLAGMFLVLGSFPLLSVKALDNLLPWQVGGGNASAEIVRIFPRNFLPIDPHGDALAAYQLGYAALGAFAMTVLLLSVARPRGAIAAVLGACLIAPFVLPVPSITVKIWRGLPRWFVAINNDWPMQRLFLIWAAVIFFGLAIVTAHDRIARRRWFCTLLGLALLGGAIWSWREARKLAWMAHETRLPASKDSLFMAQHNVLLTRYAYTSFARAPAYASHGYMDPYLENRLLNRNTLKVVTTNAEAAAPRLSPDEGPSIRHYPRLVQSGVFTAVNDNHTDFYNLEPPIELMPAIPYALRLEFLHAGEHGVLQIMDARLFREYYLPDSGAGMTRWGPSLAFGSESQNSRIVSLKVDGPEKVTPRLYFITPRRETDTILFARFWLFTYENSQLPVAVESWMPYRARVQAAAPAWLETPRLWQSYWRAQVNGREAAMRRSPQNLVMIPVGPGESHVTLEYRPPWWLQASYWSGLAGWSVVFLFASIRLWRTARQSLLAC